MASGKIAFGHNGFSGRVAATGIASSSGYAENVTYNQITIRFESEVIEVMDVIKFNSNFEIESIRAYKG